MANLQLACVIRKGLRLPEGLLAAQVAHLGHNWEHQRIIKGEQFTLEEVAWMQSPYIAILQVDTLEELKVVYGDAVANKLNTVAWTDTIYSQALDKAIADVMVGISIGPADADALKLVTGRLKLYK